jgi:hypothetical protein
MSAPVTLGGMLTSIQRRANIENQTGFVTVPELREYVNEYAAELWDLLIEARSQEHARKAWRFNCSNAVSAYPLAPDFYQLVSVDIEIAPNQPIALRPYMEEERNAFRQFPYWNALLLSLPSYYRILGARTMGGTGVVAVDEKNINLIPTPQAAYPVTVNYYPTFPPFNTAGLTVGAGIDDASIFNGVNGWENYIIWGAVRNCKHKLKEDPDLAERRFAELKERIVALASQNDAGTPDRVHDTQTDYDTGWWFH